mmetsp:Transcript_20018/g.23983  ORF Transcript_20018/g.23983 Transcript_20018/m.23983 type:complete len:97 (-) Transcript_20018:314-604(-)
MLSIRDIYQQAARDDLFISHWALHVIVVVIRLAQHSHLTLSRPPSSSSSRTQIVIQPFQHLRHVAAPESESKVLPAIRGRIFICGAREQEDPGVLY